MSIDEKLSSLLQVLKDKELFTAELSKLNIKEVFVLQVKLWDYVLKRGKEIDPDFSRSNITRRIETTSDYQYKVGCIYDEAYCRAKICFFSNPNCACHKTKDVIYALREILLSLRKDKER